MDSLENMDGFVIDLDGVIYLRKKLIPGAADFIEELRSQGRRFVFLTNNSSRTRQQYAEALLNMGISVLPERIVTSAFATARYLSEKAPGERVHVVGGSGIVSELSAAGMEVLNDAPVKFVVVGIDFGFTYEKLALASRLIRNGARFIATNRDATYPTEDGPLPGAGSIVSAIMAASGRRPVTVGKPNRWIFEICSEILGTRPDRTVVVGDRLETDVIGGHKAGMRTVLVLSGVTRKKDLARFRIQPDVIAPSVACLTRGAR